MSQLNIKLNLNSKQWNITESGIFNNTLDICFGFEDINFPVEFKNLSFGIIVVKNNSIVYHNTFPKSGFAYKSTEAEFIEIFRQENLERNTEYNITIWAINDEVKSETTYTLVTPNVPLLTDYEVV